MKKAFAGMAIGVILFMGSGSVAFAGEVTGNDGGRDTPIRSFVAASICAFSGLEDNEGALLYLAPATPRRLQIMEIPETPPRRATLAK